MGLKGLELRALSSPAVVGSTVPIAVLAIPVRVLAVQRGRAPWRLGATDTVLVLSLDVGESLSVRGGRGQKVSHRLIRHSQSSDKRDAVANANHY